MGFNSGFKGLNIKETPKYIIEHKFKIEIRVENCVHDHCKTAL